MNDQLVTASVAMRYRNLQKFFGSEFFLSRKNAASCLYHCLPQTEGETLPLQWYKKAFPHITKLSRQLQNVDSIDGQLVNADDGSMIIDDRIAHKMQTLKSLVRIFIVAPMVQRNMEESNGNSNPTGCFGEASEREAITVSSLTRVSNSLNVTAQQRKVVRFTICPQVTQHRIWVGTLREILNGLKTEMDILYAKYPDKGRTIEEQIVSSCLNFIADADNSDLESPSWMKIGASKSNNSQSSATWEDLLEMFNDLIECLGNEKGLFYHVSKLEAMKEGLAQIKDVLVDKGIGYKESRFQESLVQKKLSKTLGHSSRCLFTLLLYYLNGHVRDIEVDLCGGISGVDGGDKFCLYMGRILSSDKEEIVWNGVKQLERVLGLYKFVWETAEMKGVLELQGHLWCPGAENRTISYKGASFFVHGINF